MIYFHSGSPPPDLSEASVTERRFPPQDPTDRAVQQETVQLLREILWELKALTKGITR